MQVLNNAKQLLHLPELNPNGGARYMAKIKQALAEGKVRTRSWLAGCLRS